ncbi:Hypothetical protein CINCED_3A021413 [Cinara cedri]|uniref:Uncharacterized protein n=1 Tax=Cinara cedri TaxID=506608 RepID=A0A5E4N2Z0_9HEMI|nr:Hypothetical protein CINCED_3A021413 [Cinara cedri]
MESDLNTATALAVSLIHTKPDGMDTTAFVTAIQSKIWEKENENFFREFLCGSDSEEFTEEKPTHIIENESCGNYQSFDKYHTIMPPEENSRLDDHNMSSSASYCIPNQIQTPSTNLIQSIITMKTLNSMSKSPIDSGYDTYKWEFNSQDINQNPVETMSQSINKALDFLNDTLFDSSKLLYSFENWDNHNNLAKHFVDLITNMSEKSEFALTCRDNVTMFVQNTAFKILDNHHLYKSMHVEYQCNLLAKICYDKYIRWNIIHLLLNRLKIDIQIIPNSSTLRSMFYSFHLIDKLLFNMDFHATNEPKKDKTNLTDLWKINRTVKHGNVIEVMEKVLSEWTHLLEHISMEALRKNVFLISIRANQQLELIKLITLKKY